MNEKRLKWNRYLGNPVFPPIPGTWMEDGTANADLLKIDGKYLMYFYGKQGRHDRIGVATCRVDKFDGKTWKINDKPVINIGKSGDFDELHAIGPATVLVDGEVYLYYSGFHHLYGGSIGLAISRDGYNFEKYQGSPIVSAQTFAPEVVYRNGIFYLYYTKIRNDLFRSREMEVHIATSKDGYYFKEQSELVSPTLPCGSIGSWDSHSIATPRIFKEKNLYYMIYCGSDRFNDYPSYAGIATSRDLLHWEKYERNPIFSRGKPGEWDEGAIWFTTVEKMEETYYLWYEGYGGSSNTRTKEYAEGGKSQIGMATLKSEYFYVKP